MCCGCSNRELEERGFPLTIAIDKSERGMTVSFELPDLSKSAGEKNPIAKPMSFSVEAGAYYEAQKAYENNSNGVLDYNHLKAIIIGKEFIEDTKALRDLLSWLEQEKVVARNTCLFVATDKAAELLTLTKGSGGSVGNYLEQMVKTREDLKENKVMTIGSLMNQWHNQNEVLLIPVLRNQGGIPAVTEYAVVDAAIYQGKIPVSDALKSLLCQQQLKQFLYRLESGEVLEIENIKRNVKIQEMEKGIEVSLVLKGYANVKKAGSQGEKSNGQIEKKLNQQLKKSLETVAEKLHQELGMDICNSYILLGGHNRRIYQKYQHDYKGYKKQVIFNFSVDITLVNE